MKVALCGPPRSGKSCLRERLKLALRSESGPYPYFLNTNPDGEGAWFQEAYQNDPDLAKRLKASNKQSWSDEHAKVYAEWVRNANTPLTFIDLGGIPDIRNEIICAAATHAVILAPRLDAFEPWRDFCRKLNLTIVAELLSAYGDVEDKIERLDGEVLRGSIHRLERGDLSGDRAAVDSLAKHILALLRSTT